MVMSLIWSLAWANNGKERYICWASAPYGTTSKYKYLVCWAAGANRASRGDTACTGTGTFQLEVL